MTGFGNRVDAPPVSAARRLPRDVAPRRLDARLEHRLASRAAEARNEAAQRASSPDGDVPDRGYGHGV